MRRPRSSPLLILLALIAPCVAWAAWPNDPRLGNVPLCTSAGQQTDATIVSDGAGGAIVTWMDLRGPDTDIYVQRVSAAGVPQWTADGVALCTAINEQNYPTITSDGAGGAIVTWHDLRSGNWDVYAQRVNAAGAPQWTANGVALCLVVGDQQFPTIVSDGASGAIATWYDTRSGGNDIYAQRVNAAGAVQWTANGKAVCTNPSSQVIPTLASDGAGGAIIAWYDFRNANWDVFAQRMSSGGVAQWTADGVAVCNAIGDQTEPKIVSDGAGGAVVAWQDGRGATFDVYAQRVNASGGGAWTVNGVALCTAAGNQTTPALVSDGSGGAVVAWPDNRTSPATTDLYVQRVGANGAGQWTSNGVALCVAGGNQLAPTLASDGAGGAIVAWYDFRSAIANDVYAQRITGGGVAAWTADGAAISTAVGDQRLPVIVSDGASGAIIAWQDSRGGGYDIDAQRIDRFGYLGAEPTIASVRDVPNDQGGKVKVSWYASSLDGLSDPNLASYDLYRSAPGSLASSAARQGARVSSSFAEPPVPGERSFVVEPAKAQLYAWEYVGSTTPVHFLNAYGFIAATTGDSIGGSNPRTIFMVVGRNSSGSMYWLSAPDSGYSVDNIAPAPPQPLLGTYSAGSTALHWGVSTEGDFAVYRLYRGTSAGFVPSPSNLVTTSPDTGYVDAAGEPSYYKLSAVDVHGNESGFALLTPSGTVDVPGSGASLALRLGAPRPNPARGATRIAFDLPRATAVSLAVYDPGGRRVRELFRGRHEEGTFSLAWDLRDDAGRTIPSGMYFVRLEAMGRALTRRMVAMP